MPNKTSDPSHDERGPQLISRREFLGTSAFATLQLSSVGLLLGTRLSFADSPQSSKEFSPNVFVHISPNNRVSIICHRSEMGQGIRSSLPVLIADELGADVGTIEIIQGDGDKAYGDQNTDGSTSIRNGYEELRKMGAMARIMLVSTAADRWHVSPESCIAQNGFVVHPLTQRKFSFGDLAEEASHRPIPEAAKLIFRPKSELKHVGTDLPLIDARAFVTGTAKYGADISLPGMVIAVIARPPVVGGKVKSYDATQTLKIPGVKKVVEMPNPTPPYHYQPWGGLAVIADSTWAAMKGRKALEIVWDAGENGSYNSADYQKQLSLSVHSPGTVLRKTGDVDQALQKAHKQVEAEYYIPHLAHVPMEPPAAIAQMVGDVCEVWAPTQSPQDAQTEIARMLGCPVEKTRVHVTFLGGAFGRKAKADFVSEAAFLTKTLGKPVRVQWTREDDLQHDYYHSVSNQLMTAGLDEKGKVTAWRHRTAFPPIGTLFGGPGLPSEGDLQQGVTDFPLFVPNVQAEGCPAPAHVRIGWLRSVYNIFHSFANNSFIDELAHATGKDTLEMMLELLGPPRIVTLQELGIDKLSNYNTPLDKHPIDTGRFRKILEKVTEISNWKNRKAHGRSLGLAFHRSFLSYTAAVVSVKKNAQGKLHVDEAWVVVDGGTIVNQERVRSQMEGAVIFGISIAFHGEVTMKDGMTEQTNFDTFKIARINEAPAKIHVEIITEDDHRPGGIGEPGVPPIAPAIANAVFALTGKRNRILPLSQV